MRAIADALSDAGFIPKLYSYASTRAPIADLAKQFAKDVRANHRKRPVHAVTHSMGAIILRCVPKTLNIAWKRIVMIAPPNGGSAMAAALSGVALDALLGPSASELGEASHENAKAWPYPPAPFAVIAGTRRRSWLTPSSWISSRVFGDVDHDGTVTVEETKLPGMAAFETVDAGHTTIMHDRHVHALTVSFLRHGYFSEPPPTQPPEPPEPDDSATRSSVDAAGSELPAAGGQPTSSVRRRRRNG